MRAFEYTGSRGRCLARNTARRRAPAAPGFFARLRAILRRLRGGHHSRIAVRGLQSLSDWQLKDIGMQRSQLWHRAGGIEAARSPRITYVKD
jgi:uncharacterized protein YjiS (DUF1127 family)